MIEFSKVKEIVLPQGKVNSLAIGNVEVWKQKKQEEYTFIEYLECNSDYAFNTGLMCNQDTKLEVVFMRGDDSARYLFGVASNDNKASITAYQSGISSGSWRFGAAYFRPSVQVGVKNTIIMDKTGAIISNTKKTYTGTVGTFTTVQPLAVGGCMSASGNIGEVRFIGRLYSVRIWDGDNLIIDWVPCQTSSGEYGFYDNVSQSFIKGV